MTSSRSTSYGPRPNASEQRKVFGGLGLAGAGAGGLAAGQALGDRSVKLAGDAHYKAQSAKAGLAAVHRSREGMPQADVWHAPGTQAHAAAGRVMHEIGEAKGAVKGAQKARKLGRVGAASSVGGAAAAIGGTALVSAGTRQYNRRIARVGKAASECTDAFGVQRPDLVGKAFNPATEGKRQRRVTAGVSAIPGVGAVGGGIAAGHYAPAGHKASSGGRAFGRGLGEGLLGHAAGQVAGLGAAVASRGKINPVAAGMGGSVVGSLAGAAHGTSASLHNTQRRYGVKKPG